MYLFGSSCGYDDMLKLYKMQNMPANIKTIQKYRKWKETFFPYANSILMQIYL